MSPLHSSASALAPRRMRSSDPRPPDASAGAAAIVGDRRGIASAFTTLHTRPRDPLETKTQIRRTRRTLRMPARLRRSARADLGGCTRSGFGPTLKPRLGAASSSPYNAATGPVRVSGRSGVTEEWTRRGACSESAARPRKRSRNLGPRGWGRTPCRWTHQYPRCVPRPPDLPDYTRPPIDEVAIGIQLQAPVPGFTDAHAGLYWEEVRDQYPKAESQFRVESAPEVLEGPLLQALPIPLGPPQGGRTFLVSDDDSYLLQIQSNRFYRNWRRREDEYPHFDDLATAFQSDYGSFGDFLQKEGLATPMPLQLDVTYINWIPELPPHVFLRGAEHVRVDIPGIDEWPEDQSWTGRYLVRRTDGRPVARLHVQCVPALRMLPVGPQPGSQMSLTFLAPWREGESFSEQLEEMLATARNAIVRGFTELTTEVAHEHWGRIQ